MKKGDFVFYTAVSTRCGEYGIIVDLGPNYVEQHRYNSETGKPMKCPDSRCKDGCVICRNHGKRSQFRQFSPDEVETYKQWKMIR